MNPYEKIIFEQLGYHHIRLPNRLVTPLQVQIRSEGRPFGRFTLEQVFDADFSKVKVGEPAEVADIEETLSDTYGSSGSASMTGLAGPLKKASTKFESKSAKQLRITGVNCSIQEADQGELLMALNSAKPRDNGPLTRGRTALVIFAVASVTEFSIELETELGALIEADVELAEAAAASASMSAKVGRSGGLTLSSEMPIPFAVRLWTIEHKIFGSGLKILSPKGPMDVMGDGDASPEFVEAAGIADNAVDLE